MSANGTEEALDSLANLANEEEPHDVIQSKATAIVEENAVVTNGTLDANVVDESIVPAPADAAADNEERSVEETKSVANEATEMETPEGFKYQYAQDGYHYYTDVNEHWFAIDDAGYWYYQDANGDFVSWSDEQRIAGETDNADNPQTTTPNVASAPPAVSELLPSELPSAAPSRQLIVPLNASGYPEYPLDSKGRPVLPTGLNGKKMFPLGSDGNPLFPVDKDTLQPTFPIGDDGQPVFPIGSHGKPMVPVDPTGKPVFPKRDDGSPIFPLGPDGKPTAPMTVAGKLVVPLDNNGKAILPYGPDGQQLIMLSPDGITPIDMSQAQMQQYYQQYYQYYQMHGYYGAGTSGPPPTQYPPHQPTGSVGHSYAGWNSAMPTPKKPKVRPEDIDLPSIPFNETPPSMPLGSLYSTQSPAIDTSFNGSKNEEFSYGGMKKMGSSSMLQKQLKMMNKQQMYTDNNSPAPLREGSAARSAKREPIEKRRKRSPPTPLNKVVDDATKRKRSRSPLESRRRSRSRSPSPYDRRSGGYSRRRDSYEDRRGYGGARYSNSRMPRGKVYKPGEERDSRRRGYEDRRRRSRSQSQSPSPDKRSRRHKRESRSKSSVEKENRSINTSTEFEAKKETPGKGDVNESANTDMLYGPKEVVKGNKGGLEGRQDISDMDESDIESGQKIVPPKKAEIKIAKPQLKFLSSMTVDVLGTNEETIKWPMSIIHESSTVPILQYSCKPEVIESFTKLKEVFDSDGGARKALKDFQKKEYAERKRVKDQNCVDDQASMQENSPVGILPSNLDSNQEESTEFQASADNRWKPVALQPADIQITINPNEVGDEREARGKSREEREARGKSREEREARGKSREEREERGKSREEREERGKPREEREERGKSREEKKGKDKGKKKKLKLEEQLELERLRQQAIITLQENQKKLAEIEKKRSQIEEQTGEDEGTEEEQEEEEGDGGESPIKRRERDLRKQLKKKLAKRKEHHSEDDDSLEGGDERNKEKKKRKKDPRKAKKEKKRARKHKRKDRKKRNETSSEEVDSDEDKTATEESSVSDHEQPKKKKRSKRKDEDSDSSDSEVEVSKRSRKKREKSRKDKKKARKHKDDTEDDLEEDEPADSESVDTGMKAVKDSHELKPVSPPTDAESVEPEEGMQEDKGRKKDKERVQRREKSLESKSRKRRRKDSETSVSSADEGRSHRRRAKHAKSKRSKDRERDSNEDVPTQDHFPHKNNSPTSFPKSHAIYLHSDEKPSKSKEERSSRFSDDRKNIQSETDMFAGGSNSDKGKSVDLKTNIIDLLKKKSEKGNNPEAEELMQQIKLFADARNKDDKIQVSGPSHHAEPPPPPPKDPRRRSGFDVRPTPVTASSKLNPDKIVATYGIRTVHNQYHKPPPQNQQNYYNP